MKQNKDIIAEIVVDYYSRFPELRREDILHTQEVVSYTRMIATGEGYDPERVDMLECAAWLHDIGCPRSKEIYGNSLPVNQQNVGRDVTRELIDSLDIIEESEKIWIEDVVGTHHQHAHAIRLGFEPLFEADLIVNLLSGYYKKEQAQQLYDSLMVTGSGKELFRKLVF